MDTANYISITEISGTIQKYQSLCLSACETFAKADKVLGNKNECVFFKPSIIYSLDIMEL